MGIALPIRLPALPRLPLPRPAWLRRLSGFDALIAALAIAAFAAGPWFGERPSRTTSQSTAVIDGDSLRAADLDIRLLGIEAPELRQTCHDTQGRAWPCGQAAKTRLAALVARGEIACTVHGYDRYRRALAVCSAGDIADLGETLVREGHAVDAGGVTSRYTAAEAQARSEQRGIWRGSFERPQHLRANHRRRQTVAWSEARR
jgi:endonuclease YncB( thermonuclease family)